jgi:RHS repeat-associated protein
MTNGRADLPYAIVRGQNTTRFGYNTSDARIFKGDQTNARYYIPGIGSYDLSSKTWEHYPAGIAQIRDNVLHYTIKDHLTNTRAIVGTTATCTTPGTITAYDYYPYGKILRKFESVASRYKSTNHEKDDETGYDDRGGRWWDDERLTPIQPDPHADNYPSLSPYSSFGCNPISIIDRDGKDLIVIGSSNNSEIRRIALTGDDRYYRVNDNAFNTASKAFTRDNLDYNTMLSINSLRRQEAEGLGTNLIAEQTGYSVSVSGSMRENNNLIGDVTININADFDDGSRYSTASFDGVAGGFGNGAPENGNYSLSGYQDRSPTGWFNAGMNRDGVGFSYNLNPNFSTGRTDLRFHPDGNNEGTKGCIGLSGDANQLNSFKGRMNKILGSINSISVDINILDNPNNNGRRNNRLSNANE